MPLAKAMASLVFSPLADAGHGFSKAYVRGTQEGEERRLRQRHLVFSFLHPLVFCRMPLAKNTPLGVSLSPQSIVRQSRKFNSFFITCVAWKRLKNCLIHARKRSFKELNSKRFSISVFGYYQLGSEKV